MQFSLQLCLLPMQAVWLPTLVPPNAEEATVHFPVHLHPLIVLAVWLPAVVPPIVMCLRIRGVHPHKVIVIATVLLVVAFMSLAAGLVSTWRLLRSNFDADSLSEVTWYTELPWIKYLCECFVTLGLSGAICTCIYFVSRSRKPS